MWSSSQLGAFVAHQVQSIGPGSASSPRESPELNAGLKRKKKIKFKVFIIQLSNSNTQNRRSLQEVMFRGYRQHTIEQNAEYRRRQDELMNSSCLFILLHPHLWCLASLHTLKPWKAQPSCLYHIYFYPDTLLQKVLGLRDSILCPAMYWYDIKKETKKETNKQTTK